MSGTRVANHILELEMLLMLVLLRKLGFRSSVPGTGAEANMQRYIFPDLTEEFYLSSPLSNVLPLWREDNYKKDGGFSVL